MKVKIYVNWGQGEVLIPKEYETVVKKSYVENEKDYFDDMLDEYLEDKCFSLGEVFQFTQEKREEIIKQIKANIKRQTEQGLKDIWEEIDLEI